MLLFYSIIHSNFEKKKSLIIIKIEEKQELEKMLCFPHCYDSYRFLLLYKYEFGGMKSHTNLKHPIIHI